MEISKWLIVIVFTIVFISGCCEKTDYTGWKKVENPFYQDTESDSIWTYVGSEDYWIGIWEGKKYWFQINKDTLFIKEDK